MTKVLLTSIVKPIGPRYGDGPSVLYEPHFAQVTRAQGFFSPRTMQFNYSLNYIAENLVTPTVVLQYPSKKDLIKELRNGYDFIGVSFVMATFRSLKETVALIRKHSPNSKIILGGYGTILPDEVIKPYGDYICREEGVSFMKQLLKEKPVKKLKHPLLTGWSRIFSIPVSTYGVICAGLGCPNGCDFCCTSHFFNRKHIKLLPTGKDIADLIKEHLKSGRSRTFVFFDEDFLLNKKRAMELRDEVMKLDKTISISVFSSCKSISQYTIQELLEMGVDSVWIGYEAPGAGYSKLEGKPIDELIKELRRNGIVTLTSFILGYDYHTPEIIKKEFHNLMSLKPTYAQFLLYGPVPGTPYYKRIKDKGLMNPEYADFDKYCKVADGFTWITKHPVMKAKEIELLQQWCFKQDFQVLGPSIFRSIETWLNGYKKYKNSTNPYLKKRAERWARSIRKSYPNFLVGKLLAPNSRVKKQVKRLEQKVYGLFGKSSFKQRIKSVALIGAALWTAFKLRFNLFQHPKTLRISYHDA